MAGLKLVGGTALAAPKEAAIPSSKQAQETQARKLITTFELQPGLTLGGLLRELDANLRGAPQREESRVGRNAEITRLLGAFGLYPVIADAEDDLNAVVYGSVIDTKLLVKKIPTLKPLVGVLDELTFS